MSDAARTASHAYAERLRARFGERVVWVRLYGSYARGGAHEESDVDIAAVVRGLVWSEKVEAVDLAFDVGLARGLRLSPVVMSAEDFDYLVTVESPFAANILAEGLAA